MSFYHLSYLVGDARNTLPKDTAVELITKMNDTLDEIKRKIVDRFDWQFRRFLQTDVKFVQDILSEKAIRSPIFNMIQIPDLLEKYLPGSGMKELSKETESELWMHKSLRDANETYQDASSISLLDGGVMLMGYYASIGKGLDYLIDSLFERLNSLYLDNTETQTSTESKVLESAFFEKPIPTKSIELESLLIAAKNATSTDTKGKTLEKLAEYVFNSVEGFSVLPSVRTSTGELDRIVRVERYDDPFILSIGAHFIIEAKNWKTPVSAKDVALFSTKLQKHQCKFGVLVAMNGITGEGKRDAQGIIYDSFKDGITIVVIAEDDIKQIVEGKDLIEILREKSEQVKFS
ncbi:MAG: hypothetical protein E3J86_15075 [Candidatus Thorarchaeota archaeon]|nr:MAG: hypothetical protein E3J86_15075 [Candidatus Thorarchaeota archaeon]